MVRLEQKALPTVDFHLCLLGQDEPAWVHEHAKNEKKNSLIEKRAEFEARLKRIRAKEARQQKRFENGELESKRIVWFVSTI